MISQEKKIMLGVNVDHVATLRNARGTLYPSPYEAAKLAKMGGADGVTIHLREDRRHINDADVNQFCSEVILPVNLEMAASDEMLAIALHSKPAEVCIVPEKREELTTEGGLDVVAREEYLKRFVNQLQGADIPVSLFIDAVPEQIAASKRVGANIIELHTGRYAELCIDKQALKSSSTLTSTINQELETLRAGAVQAADLGLIVNAGHGLTLENIEPICSLPNLYCLNIGHSIIADAIFKGIAQAVSDMSDAINRSVVQTKL